MKRWALALLLFLYACAHTAYDLPYPQPDPTVEIRNESVDPYVVRYQGVRLGGTIQPGRTECVVLRRTAPGRIALDLRPTGAPTAFSSWSFTPLEAAGWRLVITNTSATQQMAYITPAAPCAGKHARQKE